MSDLYLIIIALIWFIGTLLRIYRNARFYQIEEYMNGRYLRWLIGDRQRWLPGRATGVWFIGSAMSVFMAEAPGSVVPAIITTAAAIIAVWPPADKEIKRAFRATGRAKRMLGAAFVLAGLLLMALLLVGDSWLTVERLRFVLGSLAGLITFLLAPLLLMAGSVIMGPVEAYLRGRYIAQARSVMATLRPKVIGITGSYGKTTTKNFLADILNGRYRTYATPKSYNTMMGVCLAINNDLADDYSVEYFISEMGAYIPGEIARICELTPPDISIVVEVGPQHLERFGSVDNVAIAKYEIIKALPPDGVGVFNWDNPYVRAMFERGHPQTCLSVSRTIRPEDAVRAVPRFVAHDIEETLAGLSFTVTDTLSGQQAAFSTAVMGEHNVTNLLLATAVAVHEGMSLADVAQRVRMLQPAESRLVTQTTASGITIINDAYSANPVGIVSALQVLGMHQTGRRLLITPGMVELAELHYEENYKLGQKAAQYASDVILVGQKQTQPIHDGLMAAGFVPDRLQVVETLGEAVTWYQENLRAGDTVLFLNDLPDTY